MKFKFYFFLAFLSCFCLDESHTLPAPTKLIKKDGTREAAVKKIKEMCSKYAGYRFKNTTLPNPLIGNPPIIDAKLNCHQVEALIVNGVNAKPKEFPHMALVGYGEDQENILWNCGGSLISERFVLSAAHCNHGSHGNATWVRLGELANLKRTNVVEEDTRDYKIIQVYDHKKYKPTESYNDITLYKLNEEVKFNSFVRPLCLYTETAFPNGTQTKALITGWGTTGTADDRSDFLLKAEINIMDNKLCEESFSSSVQQFSHGFQEKSQICAGDLHNGSDTCQGDSGGPLQIQLPKEVCMYFQIGITSIGRSDCGDKTHPAVYTRVSKYIEWIQEIVWPN